MDSGRLTREDFGRETGRDSARSSAASARSIRSWTLVLGLILVPVNVYWVILAEFRWLNALTLNPLFVTPIFWLAILVSVNALLRRLNTKLVLRPAELVVIYVVLVMSCTVAAFDFIIGIMISIPWPAWAASAENEWHSRLLPYLPDWLIVTDRTALKGYFQGNASAWESISAWAIPLLCWSILILVIVWMFFCLAVMLRRAWTEETKLTFPIVRLPMEMTDGESRVPILRNRLFWGGCTVAAGLSLLNGLGQYYPSLPTVPTGPILLTLGSYVWTPTTPTYVSFQPSIIGLAFLVPLDISFSCWFFYLFVKAQEVAGKLIGLSGVPNFPYVQEQSIGAWYAFGIALVYASRRHLATVVGNALGTAKTDDSQEPISYRQAFWGLVGGMVLFVGFWRAAGMSTWLALVVLSLFLLLAIAITRVRAEAGGQHTVTAAGPIGVFPLLGLDSLGPANAALGALSHAYWRGMRSHAMPSQMEAFTLAGERGIELRRLVLPMFAAFVLAVVFGFWSCLSVAYSDGALARCRGYSAWINVESYQWFSGAGIQQSSAEVGRWFIVGSSAGLVALLSWLRARFIWFPLHPLGYCIGPGMVWVWCPFAVAWLLKLLVLRYGGLKLFKSVMPFFLGLILGDYVTGAAWSLVEVIWHLPAYHVF